MMNVAVIGCGRVAGHHCAFIKALDGISLAAVCDLDAEKARARGDEFAAPWFTDYHAMLGDHPEIDTVAVITPSGMHAEHALDVIERYAKNVIVEKPTFMRPEQLIEAYGAARRHASPIFPVFQNRHNKAVGRVRRALRDGELGDIRVMNVRLRWCRPQRYYDLAPWRGTLSHDGGALTNQSIHHVDLLRHLGGEVSRVNATMRTLGADIEAEDTAVATFTYESGAVGSLEATTAARPDDFEASLSIVGSQGLAQIGGIGVNELQVFTPSRGLRRQQRGFFRHQGPGRRLRLRPPPDVRRHSRLRPRWLALPGEPRRLLEHPQAAPRLLPLRRRRRLGGCRVGRRVGPPGPPQRGNLGPLPHGRAVSGEMKVGIAGYGVVGKRRRAVIDAHPAFRTVAVSDIRLAGDGSFDDGVRYAEDYATLFEESLDVLFVCLPNDVAPLATIGGLERGLHVFCEKPPGRDLGDVARVIAAEKRHPGPQAQVRLQPPLPRFGARRPGPGAVGRVGPDHQPARRLRQVDHHQF